MKRYPYIPIYEKIKADLRKKIKDATYKFDDIVPSEHELATMFNVSQSTAVKAIRDLVHEGLLYRIQGKGTFVAGQKESLPSKSIGVVIETDVIHCHAPFTKALSYFFQENGYLTTIFDLGQSSHLKGNLKRFLNEKPKALIVDGCSIFPFEVLENFPQETRLIFLNRFEGPQKYKASYILSDYRKGGYLTTKHLLNLGRKRILIISFGIQPGWTSDLFFQGCKNAFQEAGLEPFFYLDSKESCEAACERMFTSSQKPDAIISFGDYRVVPVLEVLKRLNLKVPEEVAIIGYFNTPWAYTYQLTSLSIREELIAEKVGEVLESDEEKEVFIEPELIFRNSCPEESQKQNEEKKV